MLKQHINPEESLDIIRTTLSNVRHHLFYSSGPVYRMWAIAWFIAFITTFFGESESWGITLSGTVIGVLWAVVMTVAGLYTFVFYRNHPVDADYRKRFSLIWLVAFTLSFLTVWSQGALGLPFDTIQLAIDAVQTLSIIYLVTGAVLLDGVQTSVGIWLGVSNLISLQLGFPNYALAMGLLLAIGLFIAGWVDDRRRRDKGSGGP